ncbi:three-Cys-motif partner protein TcmP [Amycolatopsis roodepoortensis]|uniref:three-Cys-motif partner protein TcmP n=1 Tax=Amycolatopsis roodepoortensis TaxID=700274 RepID=UPI00214B503F|nr:three-Cys-motif partner protein TcmP [Amycolatopsis roodepoortensis]UUV28701.1 three-Cys-motif partner protein TcmP [Amycolatopsis roodepoortensis]
MTANDLFFQRKQAAAVLKHGVLMRYPPVFATMTGSTSDGGRVVYLDGYAGPGRYEPEGDETIGAPGSPLLAVRSATTIAQWSRDLHCIFIERNPQYAENLRRVLNEEANAGLNFDVLKGDVQDQLNEALALVGKSPLLTFLDPFGTALPYEAMTEQLMGRDSDLKTEVLLNLNLEMVWRIGGLLTGKESDPERTKSGSSATLERIDAFLGGDWWRETFTAARESKEPGSAARAAHTVATEFCRRVLAATGFQSFSVPIRRRPHHPPLFLLILFYRHQAAPYQFNEAVSGANAEWREHFRQADLSEDLERRRNEEDPDLFGEDLIVTMSEQEANSIEAKLEDQWVATITTNITTLLDKTSALRIEASFADIYGKTLGLAREKHLRRAWDQLYDAGLVLKRDKAQKIRRLTINRVI